MRFYKTEVGLTIRGRVCESDTYIPESDRVPRPLEANHVIKTAVLQGEQVVEEEVGFVLGDVVDSLRKCLVDKEAFPTGNSCGRGLSERSRRWKDGLTICSDNGMHSLQVVSLIVRTAPFPRTELDTETPRLVVEKVGIVRRRQRLQPPRHRGAQLVVNIVGRGPQRITARLRERMDLEHRIVARDGFKCDIAVPCVGSKEGPIIVHVSKATAFGLLFAADHGDLVAQFGRLFCQRVDVQVGRRGLARELTELGGECGHLLRGQILVTEEANAAARDYGQGVR